MTKVIVMTDAMTVSEIDGHRLAVMATTQRHRTDVAAGNRITPKVLVDQDADSPGETKTEVTHDLGIEIHSGNKEKRKKAYKEYLGFSVGLPLTRGKQASKTGHCCQGFG